MNESIRDTSYLRLLNEHTNDLIEKTRYDSVLTNIREAQELAIELNDLEGESFAFTNLGNYYLERGIPDSVVVVLGDKFNQYLDTNKGVEMGNILATAHNKLGDFRRSLELYSEILELAKEKGDTRMIMGITQNLGNSYSSLGDMPAAIDSYLTSLEMAEEAQDTLVLAIVLDNLATVNSREENFKLAEQYLNYALELNQKIDNYHNQITNYMSLGRVYRSLGKYEQAHSNYNRVLTLADSLDHTLSKMQAYYNIGLLNHEMEEYDQAIEMFQQSLDMSRRHNIPIGAFYNNIGIADTYVKLNKYESAVELYELALSVAETSGSITFIGAALQSLYETNEKLGDTIQAYSYLKRHQALSDSLAKTEREGALARQEAYLELRLERERRELTEENLINEQYYARVVSILLGSLIILFLIMMWFFMKAKKTNKKLQKKTHELTRVNKVKDKLLSVLSHDLRTPIANIQGVIFLIRENMLKGRDINKTLDEIDAKLQHGIGILTNYLQWAQHQTQEITAKMEDVSLYELVKNAKAEYDTSMKKKNIQFINHVPNQAQAYADSQLLSVILRNLLSNAIKFVNRGGNITIRTEESKTELLLHVHDNGPGIPADKQKNIFNAFTNGTDGTEGESGTGLGLSICKDFAVKQQGNISIESKQGIGTTITLHLKKSKNPIKEVETIH